MTRRGLKATSFAALTLAFASFGDAFLYPFLPINHASVGISTAAVGVILSVNRFVRIIANNAVVTLFAKYGLRSVMIGAAMLAVISTAGYALASAMVTWLLLRIAWGLSFSALRIGALGYSLFGTSTGLSLGISRSLQDLGPMIALLISPFLIEIFDVRSIFIALALLSLPALFLAYSLPIDRQRSVPVPSKLGLTRPSSINALTFISAVVIDGILIVVLGILILQHAEHVTPTIATAVAAFYLGYRRICLVFLSPVAGWLADNFGHEPVVNISTLLLSIGLILLIAGSVDVGAVIVFAMYSVQSAITPGVAVIGQARPLASVAENATWRDLGAAIGTLVGGLLIDSPYVTSVIAFAIFMMALTLVTQSLGGRRTLKLLSLWK